MTVTVVVVVAALEMVDVTNGLSHRSYSRSTFKELVGRHLATFELGFGLWGKNLSLVGRH